MQLKVPSAVRGSLLDNGLDIIKQGDESDEPKSPSSTPGAPRCMHKSVPLRAYRALTMFTGSNDLNENDFQGHSPSLHGHGFQGHSPRSKASEVKQGGMIKGLVNAITKMSPRARSRDRRSKGQVTFQLG